MNLKHQFWRVAGVTMAALATERRLVAALGGVAVASWLVGVVIGWLGA